LSIKELKLDLLGKIKNPDFQVRRRMLSRILEGEFAASTKGQGIEFTGYRKYTYGDDASQIDWPASLRAKNTMIREFEQYRNFQIFVMLDVSDSMIFSSTEQLKCEYAAEMAFSIVYSVVNSGNKIGLSMFNDKLITKRIPSSGTKNYYQILQDLTNPKNYGGQFDMKKPLNQARALLFDKSLIIILSDFIGVKEKWNNYIGMLTQEYEVLGVMIRDPRDFEIPKDAGQYLVEDPFTGEKLRIDATQYAELYKKKAAEEEADIERKFLTSNAGFIKVRTDEDFINPLMKYVNFRARMLAKRQQ